MVTDIFYFGMFFNILKSAIELAFYVLGIICFIIYLKNNWRR